jgi:hypothetical protein
MVPKASPRAADHSWAPVISSDGVVAIHAALVPAEGGEGEIILFGGDNHSIDEARAGHFDHTRRFNCLHPELPLIQVQSPTFDVFCCGHAFLSDGRLLVAGGTLKYPPDAGGIHHAMHFEGHRHCAVYTPASDDFSVASDMGPQPGRSTGGGRWYPTLCTLADGDVLAFQGHPAGDDTRHGNNTAERYQPSTNTWVMLPTPVGDVRAEPILYPRTHLLRDGSVFVSSRVNGFESNISLDPTSGTAREVSPLPDAAYHDFNCPSVLLPLVPDDDYRPRVLLAGGARSQLIDLGQANPNWVDVPRLSNIMMAPGTAVTALWRSNDTHLDLFATSTNGGVWSTFWETTSGWQPWFQIHPETTLAPGTTITALWRSNDTHLDLFATSTNGGVWSTFWETTSGWQPWFQIHPESRARTHSCATLLPTGDVLLTGGAAPDNDQAGVMEPELYSAPVDRRQGRYLPGTGVWQTIANPAKVLRNYHSTALLMPDCRVWTAGGNSPNQPDQPPTPVQEQIEIYEPPYPAGPRPRITACPSSARYNSDFTVAVSDAAVIAAMMLMRCGSSTHAFDADQRAVLLHFQATGSNTLIATAPPSGTVAPPGPYMLFVVDDAGRPCEYAKFIQVGV